MFGFNKKKKEQKKQSNLDKILMGVVVGGAIGSVLGVGLAPKKGTETRKEVSSKAGKFFHRAKNAVTGVAGKLIKSAGKNDPKSSSHPRQVEAKYGSRTIPEEK